MADAVFRVRSEGTEQLRSELGGVEDSARRLGRTRVGIDGRPARRTLDDLGRRMDSLGRRGQQLGQTMMTHVSLPIVGAFGASVKSALTFETTLARIEGLVGASKSQISEYRAALKGMAGELGKAPAELADALYFITSAGASGAQALDILRESAKASAAGLGETASIADAVTSAVNAYGPAVLKAGAATDVLVATVREGKAEAASIAQEIGKVIPFASQMGVEFHEVGAAVAAMTRTGTDAATATTQLRALLASFLKPAAQSVKQVEDLGLNFGDLRKQLREDGLLAAMQTLVGATEGNEEALNRIFPNIRAVAAIMDVMGGSAEANAGIFDRLARSGGDTDRAFAAAAETAQHKLNVQLAKLKSAAIDAGNELLPFAVTAAEKVGDLARAFSSLDPRARRAALAMAAVAAAAGPLLWLGSSITRGVGAGARALGALAGMGRRATTVAGSTAGMMAGGIQKVYVVNMGPGGMGGRGGAVPPGGVGPAGSGGADGPGRLARFGALAARGGSGLLVGAGVGAGIYGIGQAAGLPGPASSILAGAGGGAAAGAMVGGLPGAIAGAALGGLIQGFRSFTGGPSLRERSQEIAERIAGAMDQPVSDALVRATQAVERRKGLVRAGKLTGGTGAAERDLEYAYQAQGKAAAQAFAKGLAAGPTFRTARALVRDAKRGLDELEPGAQKAAMRAMVAQVRELEKGGRAAKGTTRAFIKAIINQYGELGDDLPAKVRKSAAAVEREFKFDRAVKAAGVAMRQVGDQFDDAPRLAKTSSSNVRRQYEKVMDFLSKKSKTGSRKQRAAARVLMQRVTANYQRVIDKAGELDRAYGASGEEALRMASKHEQAASRAQAAWDAVAAAVPDTGVSGNARRGTAGRGNTGGYSRGGYLPGRYRGVDSIPAMLSPGEVVLTPTQEALADRGLTVREAVARTGGRVQRFAKGGYAYPLAIKGRILGTPYAGTHTIGNWQSDLAYDLGAPAGTVVRSPISGSVTRIQGSASQGGRFGGLGIYVSGPGGSYFLKHLGSASVKVGSRVSAGTAIGTVGNYYGASNHVHFAASSRAALQAAVGADIRSAGSRHSDGEDGPAPMTPKEMRVQLRRAMAGGLGSGTPRTATDVAGLRIDARHRDDQLQDARTRDAAEAAAARDGISNPDKVTALADKAVTEVRLAEIKRDAADVKRSANKVRGRIKAGRRRLKKLYRQLRKTPGTRRERRANLVSAITEQRIDIRDLIDELRALIRQGADLQADAEYLGYQIGELAREIAQLPDSDPLDTDPATTTAPDPATEAALAREQEARRIAERTAGLSESFIRGAFGPGDIGEGGRTAIEAAGGVVRIDFGGVLSPTDPGVLRAIADSVVAGFGAQGARPAKSVRLGI